MIEIILLRLSDLPVASVDEMSWQLRRRASDRLQNLHALLRVEVLTAGFANKCSNQVP